MLSLCVVGTPGRTPPTSSRFICDSSHWAPFLSLLPQRPSLVPLLVCKLPKEMLKTSQAHKSANFCTLPKFS